MLQRFWPLLAALGMFGMVIGLTELDHSQHRDCWHVGSELRCK